MKRDAIILPDDAETITREKVKASSRHVVEMMAQDHGFSRSFVESLDAAIEEALEDPGHHNAGIHFEVALQRAAEGAVLSIANENRSDPKLFQIRSSDYPDRLNRTLNE